MEKLNIAELLKDCPTGMELDCTVFEDVYFDCIEQEKSFIRCYIQNDNHKISVSFTKYGCYASIEKSKCVIFPKGKTTWEGFQRPFKDGDVLCNDKWNSICIYKKYDAENRAVHSYCGLNIHGTFMLSADGWTTFSELRFATKEEKQKLFDAIKDNGYKWNPETKTLEKLIVPKFKVGDRIKKKGDTRLITIKDVRDNYYIITFLDDFGHCYVTDKLSFSKQDDYELVPNKFDITTLKPFESRVLVRSSMDGLWKPAVFGFRNGYNDNAFFIVGGSCWKQCIPYLNNEHLCGTTNDCDDYYKTWE